MKNDCVNILQGNIFGHTTKIHVTTDQKNPRKLNMNFRRNRGRTKCHSTTYSMPSTEKWRTFGKRVSRKEITYDDCEDESEEDEHKSKDLVDWVEEFFGRRSTNEGSEDVEVILSRKQTLILSTLVPDELLLMEKFDSGEPKRFVGVLLMADVSGYTALSERYNNTGKGGTYRLTVTLNTYLGSLIEVIYGHGGDIIKFAGDAFLALWKTDKKTFLCHTIHTVITCALIIQHSYSKYETDVKVNLKVKLAISAGNLMFAPIGSGIDMTYVIFGLPVLEAKLAESVCASGEVKLTPSAWAHCYSRNYDHIIHEDGHVTIRSILYDPTEKDVSKPFTGFPTLLRQVKKQQGLGIENLPDLFFESSNINSTDALRKNAALSLRKTILIAEEKNIGSEIRKFMIRPVLTQVDAHQPLEYLTEMRQVSVLFVTLKPNKCSPGHLITIVNNSYQITCEIVYKSMGCVNKIILFDKDIMILVIFGLRGFKHESEAQAALKCAFGIRKAVSALDGVQEVSIGVTTGQVYCGVVGHPLRREFTVIGATVNKAARLMCSHRNKITCDEATFVKSKMSKNGFTLLPTIELKGIGHPGKIYEYSEDIRMKELNDIMMIPPLLDRTDEMEYFDNWLDTSHLSYRDFDALLLIGESRIGKTRLLEWMARYASNKGLNVCHISLTSIHSANPYLALSQIINQILGLQEPVFGFAKEEKILDLLKEYNEDLCYLNNIIKVRFAYHEGVYSLNEQMRRRKAKVVFEKLIMVIKDVFVICIDDLQNLDTSSWEFISIIFSAKTIFTVLTVTRSKFSAINQWLYNVFIDNCIRKIVLGPLTSSWIPPLACQILDVDAVPLDLCNALKIKCKGYPGLVESFILHMFSTGAIELKKITDEEINEWKKEELQFPDPKLLQPQALYVKDQEKLDEMLKNDSTDEISICVINEKKELDTNINVQNIDALLMIQIDSLTPYQQLLLKIASVIGNELSRDLLENIMYENNPLTTAKAIKRLFTLRILCCANYKGRNYRRGTSCATMSLVSTDENIKCKCIFDYDEDESNILPKFAYCKLMRFRNKNSRKTFYELLPMNQKKEFHSRIVNYLENNRQKCTSCGGTMIVQSFANEEMEDERLSIREFEVINSETSDEEKSMQNNSVQQIAVNGFELKPDNNIETLKAFQKSSYKKSNSITSYNVPSIPIMKGKSSEQESTSQRFSKRVTMPSFKFKESQSDYDENHILTLLRPVIEARNLDDWHILGVVDSCDNLETEKNTVQNSSWWVNIERGVSRTNFRNCTCAELSISIYNKLVYHAEQAELKIKAIEFLIHYSYLNLLSEDLDTAIEKLNEAEKNCSEKQLIELSSFDRRRFLGKIYSMKAAAFLMSANCTAAKFELNCASRIYSLKFQKPSTIYKLKSFVAQTLKKRRKHRMHENLMKVDSVFCLNVATLLYNTMGDEKASKASAFRAVDLIQEVECNFIDICDALCNAMQFEIDRGLLENTIELERIVKTVLKNYSRSVQVNELFALGKLFLTTFRAQLFRGSIVSSIHSGFRAIVISNFMHANNVSLDIIPDLFYALLCRRRIAEAIDILKSILRINHQNPTLVCETWYFALCMDMILDAGFQLESPYEIHRYGELVISRDDFQKSPGRRRLIVNLWTYWLRADVDRKAKKYEAEALSWLIFEDDDNSFITLMNALRLAEAMLESLARKVDDLRKVVDLMELRSIADRELHRLERDCQAMKPLYCRWFLLKATSLKLSGRSTTSTTLINQGLEEAYRINNHLEAALLKATLSNSRLWLQSARTSNFMNWRFGMEQAVDSWHQLLYKITTSQNT